MAALERSPCCLIQRDHNTTFTIYIEIHCSCCKYVGEASHCVHLASYSRDWKTHHQITTCVMLQSCSNILRILCPSRVKTCWSFLSRGLPWHHHITHPIITWKMGVVKVTGNHTLFKCKQYNIGHTFAGDQFKAPFWLSCAGFSYSRVTVQGAPCACVIKTNSKRIR